MLTHHKTTKRAALVDEKQVKPMSKDASSTSSSTLDSEYENRHLFLLIHGFFGNPSHLEAMKITLQKRFPAKTSDIDVLLPAGNTGLRSFDGIELGAQRIVEELAIYLADKAKDKIRYNRISIVGYSLGGLYARYVVGLLNSTGFFDKVEPVFFTTFASPHVGTKFHGGGFGSKLLNFLGSRVLGVSGNDMFEADSDILREMSDPDKVYYKGLEKFKHLMLFANAIHDRTVPFFTSFITDKDPFTNDKRDFVDLEYFAVDGENDKFFVDMNRSTYRTASNGVPYSPTKQERQFQAFAFVILPIMFPILLAVTSISTLVSRYRVREAFKAKQQNKSTLVPHKSHSERIAELTYYAIDDILLEGGAGNKDSAFTGVTAPGAASSGASAAKSSVGLLDSMPDKLKLKQEIHDRIEVLNKLPWEKYAVFLKRMHSHAEIVNRRNMPGQGQQVLQFWVNLVESKM